MTTVFRTGHKQNEERLHGIFLSPLLVPVKEPQSQDKRHIAVLCPLTLVFTTLSPLHLFIHPDLSSETYRVLKPFGLRGPLKTLKIW